MVSKGRSSCCWFLLHSKKIIRLLHKCLFSFVNKWNLIKGILNASKPFFQLRGRVGESSHLSQIHCINISTTQVIPGLCRFLIQRWIIHNFVLKNHKVVWLLRKLSFLFSPSTPPQSRDSLLSNSLHFSYKRKMGLRNILPQTVTCGKTTQSLNQSAHFKSLSR